MPTANTFDIHPFFLPGTLGPLFALFYRPHARQMLGRVLYLPPFAEEMHKSRRMAALQARAFAEAGYAVLQFDLTGCGDSAADFGDATWDLWLDDALRAHAWLAGEIDAPGVLWGLRTGGLLATRLSGCVRDTRKLVLWHPVLSGAAYLNQFLRIKLASEMIGSGPQSNTPQLLAQLNAGAPVEVGGYRLNPAMAQSLSTLRLDELTPGCAVDWHEMGAQPSPANQRVIAQWQHQGHTVQAYSTAGNAFWSTQEITACPALIMATLAKVKE